jgi:hypothetical protein
VRTAHPALLERGHRVSPAVEVKDVADHIAEQAALVATQVLRTALCRYVLSIPPVAAMERTTVSAWLGPTLQRYLVGTS